MATSFAYDKNGNLVEQNEYDWVSSFPASGSAACNLPGSNPIRNTSYTHWAPPRNSGGSRILATEGDPLPAEYKNAQNAYWSMSAPAKRDSILDVRVSGGTAANPTPLVVQSVTQFEYDNHATSGNVTRQLEWNSVLRPSVPPVAVTAVTLSGASDSAVTQHSYATGSAGQTVPTQTIIPGGLTTNYEYGSSAGCGSHLYVTTRKVAPGLSEQTQSNFEYL